MNLRLASACLGLVLVANAFAQPTRQPPVVSPVVNPDRTVTFRLTEKDLSYWNNELKFKTDPGEFQVFVGGNSRDVKSATFEWVK